VAFEQQAGSRARSERVSAIPFAHPQRPPTLPAREGGSGLRHPEFFRIIPQVFIPNMRLCVKGLAFFPFFPRARVMLKTKFPYISMA
jgi:hypothetical protein